ncbi:MAG: hypothetical protein RLZZ71_1982 [Bacteroidota bacterium]|jgi:hypothetical protein
MLRVKDLLFFSALTFAHLGYCQNIPFTSFNPFVSDIPLIVEHNFGSGVSLFDVDEDGWDDLTLTTDTGDTRFYRNVLGQFVLTFSFTNTKNGKSCVWGDVNEDGFNDLLVSRYDDEPQLFLGLGENSFQEVFIGLNNPFMPNDGSTGLALGDLNRDGFLDVGVANYSYYLPNRVYLNEGGTSFTPLNYPVINNNTHPSLQPCWIDVNNDLYPELFIVNDHEFPNELYSFSGNEYTEIAAQKNLIFPADAMSNSWEDYDRDGDMDLFISNSPNLPNFLLQNDGNGNFSDVYSSQPWLYNLIGWSGLWIDKDNDSWSDLFICTRGGSESLGILNNKLYLNNQGTLEETSSEGLTSSTFGYYASAKGDINNDGLSDIVMTPEFNGSVAELTNALNHFVYKNTAQTTNHYFKFRLEGRLSNRNGFGTKYIAYFDSGLVSGYTMSAGNYLGQSSQNIIIGLGQSTSIDSLVLVWPSGVIDHYYNLNSNQFQLLTEAETLMGIQTEAGHCPGDPATASLLNWPVVQWSNNDTTATTTFYTSQISATVGTGFGHVITLSAQAPEAPLNPYDLTTITPATCFGSNDGIAVIHLESPMGETLAYEPLSNLSPGNYSLNISYNSTCQTTVAFDIALIDSTEIHFNTPQFVCQGDSLLFTPSILNSSGNLIWSGVQPNNYLTSGEYISSVTTPNGCFIDTSFTVSEIAPPTVFSSINQSTITSQLILDITGENQPYTCTWEDGSGGNIFYWNASTVANVEIEDAFGCIYDSSFVLIGVQEMEETLSWHSTAEGIYFSGDKILHDLEVYNEIGQLLDKRPYLQANTVLALPKNYRFIIRSKENIYFFSK